jgi:hypothetical protein
MQTEYELRRSLRDGSKHFCHYCHIEQGDFIPLWRVFYKTRGYHLEIDHKDNNRQNKKPDNLVLACALCNCAKSNKITYNEFKKVGKIIQQIYEDRATKNGYSLTKGPNSK